MTQLIELGKDLCIDPGRLHEPVAAVHDTMDDRIGRAVVPATLPQLLQHSPDRRRQRRRVELLHADVHDVAPPVGVDDRALER